MSGCPQIAFPLALAKIVKMLNNVLISHFLLLFIENNSKVLIG